MANRSYLYSLSNRPASYADRPETISGLAEWAYAVPFSFRVLMSGAPQACASLISDGFEDEPIGQKSKLHAISAEFAPGFARLERLCAVARQLASGNAPSLTASIDTTLAYLEEHQDRFLLLETIELDMMTEEGAPAMRAAVEREIAKCKEVGAAIDALPSDLSAAAAQLASAASPTPAKPWWRWGSKPPTHAFAGLVFNDDFDDVRGNKTEYPLGLSNWSDVLYFQLWNRARFEASAEHPNED